jgi:hypothetical protein
MANVGSYITPLEGNQGSRVYDISQEVLLRSQFTPLVYEMGLQNSRPTTDVRFQWDEKDYQSTYTQINQVGRYSVGITSFVVDDASIFTVRDTVINHRTREEYQIQTVTTATNTITVLRNIGSTGQVALNDDDGLEIIGNAMEQASSSPNENNANTSTVYNYAQTMRKSFSESGTRIRTNSTPGMSYQDFVAIELDEALKRIEMTLIFGKRSLDQTNFNKENYYTNGLENMISTNVTAVGGTLSETAWSDFLTDQAFAYGSKEKIMICGANYFKAFKKFATDSYTPAAEISVGARLGIGVSSYIAPTGQILNIYQHELFRQGLHPGLGIVIDAAGLRLRYTDGSQNPPADMLYKNGLLQFGENIQSPDTDGVKSEYFSELGLELRNESWHAVISGVTGPA